MKMTKTKIRAALLATAAAAAFESGKAGWKMDGDKIATDANGNPIYLKEDGSEQAVEGNTISRLNAEAKQHRERAEKAEAAAKPFEGLDPAKAREAIDKLGKIDQKTLIDAGEVDRVKAEIAQQYQGQLDEAKTTNSTLQSRVDQLTIGSAFASSEFIANRIAVPREMFEATFGKNFKVEDGKVVPYDASGNKIYSKKTMGEIAGIDEAFEIMVDGYAHKDSILRAPDKGGSGSGGQGGNRGGGRVVRRADFEAMTPVDQATVAGQAAKGEVVIAD